MAEPNNEAMSAGSDEGVTAADAVTAEDAALWAELDAAEKKVGAAAPVDVVADLAPPDDQASADRATDAAAAAAEVPDAGQATVASPKSADALEKPKIEPAATAGGGKAAQATGTTKKAGGDTANKAVSTDRLSEQDLAALPEHVRSHVSRIEQENRTHRGRQSRLANAETTIHALTEENTALKGGRRGTAEGDGKDKGAAPGEPKDWADLKRNYPEVAAGIEAQFGTKIRTLEQENVALKAFRDGLNGERTEAFVDSQIALLAEAHPDWREVATSKEYGEWLKLQPDVVQNAHRKNAQRVVDAASAEIVIGRFKTQNPNFKAAAATGDPPPADAGTGSNNTRTAAPTGRRQRQLEGAAAPSAGSKSRVPQQGIPAEAESEEAMWDSWDKYDKAKGTDGGARL